MVEQRPKLEQVLLSEATFVQNVNPDNRGNIAPIPSYFETAALPALTQVFSLTFNEILAVDKAKS